MFEAFVLRAGRYMVQFQNFNNLLQTVQKPHKAL